MRRLILLGGGHAHLEVLRQAAARPFDGTELTLVSPSTRHHYSGMVPGYLQGLYRERQLVFDLPALCRAAGARFREAYAGEVDPAGRWVAVDGARVECDLVSADVGSGSLGLGDVPGAAEHAVPLRPITHTVALRRRLGEAVRRAAGGSRDSAGASLAVAVVGGGAAGVEVALAVRRRFADAGLVVAVTLVERSATLLAERGPHVGRIAERLLAERQVQVRTDRAVARVTADAVVLDSGETVPSALTIWLAGAAPTALTAASDLPKDDDGFWLVDETLRSVGGGAVWGAGDCVALAGHPSVPKSGVHAVREGPVLAANLRAAAEGGAVSAARHAVRRYVPQRFTLALLNTADGRALLHWRGLTAHTRWAWWLKDAIDRRFVARYQAVQRGAPAVVPRIGDGPTSPPTSPDARGSSPALTPSGGRHADE
jgi:selenide,water dikinase